MYVIVLLSPVDMQLERLVHRDALDKASAMKRIQAQMPRDEKCRMADTVLDNSGTLDRTFEQVDILVQRMKPSLVQTVVGGGLFVPYSIGVGIVAWWVWK
jgi:dephospho-CoA kinase